MRLVADNVQELDLAEFWPKSAPLVAFVGSGQFHVVATSFSEVPPTAALSRRWGMFAASPEAERAVMPPFCCGWVGLVAYDSAPHRVFRVHRALIHDRARRCLWLSECDGSSPAQFALGTGGETALIAAMQRPTSDNAAFAGASSGFALIPCEDDEEYLRRARAALEDIRGGRYYQINLLRRFRLASPLPSRADLLRRLRTHGGPYSVVFDVPGLSVLSFSPERFVSIRPDAAGWVAETFPVKGTATRHVDDVADRAAAAALLASAKDRAELSMIVDLMRNDLGLVAAKGSVTVPEPLVLTTHANVHHLSARVMARLRPETSLGDVLAALCPGGSITGAPKREVMAAIAALEGVPRGYFMGHAFYLDERGNFDSSILIRTLVRQGKDAYTFAAGSGLVVKSDVRAELEEITAKARVVGPVI